MDIILLESLQGMCGFVLCDHKMDLIFISKGEEMGNKVEIASE